MDTDPRTRIALLGDADRDVRLQAVMDLGEGRHLHAAPALVARYAVEHDFFIREALTWASIHLGRKVDGQTVMEGFRSLRSFARDILAFYEDCDVMLTPVMGTAPPRIGHIDPVNVEPREVQRRQGRAFPFTPPVNVTGQPAISLPLCWSESGLPIGMHFIARYADEATLYRLAGQLEAAQPWQAKRPPHFG